MAKIVGYGDGEHRIAPANAERTLATMRIHLDTGNDVDVTPSMRQDQDAETERIIFVQCWRLAPAADELAAVSAELDTYCPGGVVSDLLTPPQAEALAEHFLSGRKPQ